MTIFRVFNIYGPGLKKGRLISDLLNNYLNNENLQLNDPTPIRDYLYIEDFIRLIFILLKTKKAPGDVFNVGSGKSYSNMDVAKTILSFSKNKLGISNLSNPREKDISKCTVDITKVVNHFKWIPEYSLHKGLKNTLAILKKKNGE